MWCVDVSAESWNKWPCTFPDFEQEKMLMFYFSSQPYAVNYTLLCFLGTNVLFFYDRNVKTTILVGCRCAWTRLYTQFDFNRCKEIEEETFTFMTLMQINQSGINTEYFYFVLKSKMQSTYDRNKLSHTNIHVCCFKLKNLVFLWFSMNAEFVARNVS